MHAQKIESERRSQFLALTKRLASSGDKNEHDLDSSLQTPGSIAVIAVESAIMGEKVNNTEEYHKPKSNL